MSATGSPFTIPLPEFIAGLHTNMISPFAAISESIEGFQSLPKETLKTFIYTGNLCLHLVMPVALNLALGKRGAGFMIENAVMLYEKEGFKYAFQLGLPLPLISLQRIF